MKHAYVTYFSAAIKPPARQCEQTSSYLSDICACVLNIRPHRVELVCERFLRADGVILLGLQSLHLLLQELLHALHALRQPVHTCAASFSGS